MLNEVQRLTQGAPFTKNCKNGDVSLYEYQYILIFNNIIIDTSLSHLTDEEAKELHAEHGKWCKVIETKRERKEKR